MTHKELFEKMIKWIDDNPGRLHGLCSIESIVTYGIVMPHTSHRFIQKYKPTWKSKFWWQWSYIGRNFDWWWKLDENGMKKRKEYLEYLIKKLEHESTI